MEGICRKCGKRKDIKELYDMIIISMGHTHKTGERDCEECRRVIEKDDSRDRSIF